MTPNGCPTPNAFSKAVLGRTPTRLYSPFGIESPYNKPTTYDKENIDPKSVVAFERWRNKFLFLGVIYMWISINIGNSIKFITVLYINFRWNMTA